MASSHEILVSSHELSAGPGQRERWADNLRVLVIAVVVVWHTATAYLGDSNWYYVDRATSKAWATAFFPVSVISLFALGPLFLVAGWFSARSLAHKGAGAFARARLLRLGVPLIVFIFVINPLAAYLGALGQGLHPDLADYLGGVYAAGPMWFVAALLVFSLAYALLRRVHPAPVARRWSGVQVMVAAAVLIAVATFVVWHRWPPYDGSTFWDLRWQSWPQGAVLFALGVWAGEAGSLEDLTAWARRLGWTALAAAAVFVALGVYEQARGQLDSALGDHARGGPVRHRLRRGHGVVYGADPGAVVRRWPAARPRRAGVLRDVLPASGAAHRDHGAVRVAGAGSGAEVPGRGRGGGPGLFRGRVRGHAGPQHLQGTMTASGPGCTRGADQIRVDAVCYRIFAV
jgi:fucose 4-O-acetylase-like acetyltransferase